MIMLTSRIAIISRTYLTLTEYPWQSVRLSLDVYALLRAAAPFLLSSTKAYFTLTEYPCQPVRLSLDVYALL